MTAAELQVYARIQHPHLFDPMSLTQAEREFGFSHPRILKLVDKGVITAHPTPSATFVSRAQCELVHATSGRLVDPISLTQAGREFGFGHPKITRLIDEGVITAYPTPSATLVSRVQCALVHATLGTFRGSAGPTDRVPADGKPIGKLADEFDIAPEYLQRWCRWDPHPALRRKIRQGIGPYLDLECRRWIGILASHEDIKNCVDSFRQPLYRRFPGNPGLWVADGLFQHINGQLYYTDKCLESERREKDRRVPHTRFRLECYRKKLETITLVWPRKGPHRWTLQAHSGKSVQAVFDWRNGKVGHGCWFEPRMIWVDGDAISYSTGYVARERGVDIRTAFNELRVMGSVPRRVPSGGVGPSIAVHDQEIVGELLGWEVESGTKPSLSGAQHVADGGDNGVAGSGPAVVLGGEDDSVFVCGVKLPPISGAAHSAVLALLEAGEPGLSLPELKNRSGYSSPDVALRRLAEKYPQWKQVIVFPGKGWGRYRILSRWP
jgi:hypothetical protein